MILLMATEECLYGISSRRSKVIWCRIQIVPFSKPHASILSEKDKHSSSRFFILSKEKFANNFEFSSNYNITNTFFTKISAIINSYCFLPIDSQNDFKNNTFFFQFFFDNVEENLNFTCVYLFPDCNSCIKKIFFPRVLLQIKFVSNL
jgi:hypothetical protein